MARQKKEAKVVTFNLATEIIEKLDNYCKETGLSKTTAVEKFIENNVQTYENEKGQLRKTHSRIN